MTSNQISQQDNLQAPLPGKPDRVDSDEPNYDIPQSQEEKPEAYPDGPICVYEPHVDLYLEPSLKQAMHYDVILNVASEVRNPFLRSTTPTAPTPAIRLDGGGGIQYATRRNSEPERIEHAALSPVREASSPTTPKATPLRESFKVGLTPSGKTPEYIHIPWEHNTDIVPDLLRLVKLIDDRVLLGKRVLVHCQCGVSRSATLVVAYCLYKHPEMSVQEAYDTVKIRSKWIGPNMNLIMQLQEFRSTLTGSSRRNIGRSLTPIEASSSWQDWKRSSWLGQFRSGVSTPKTAPLLLPIPTSAGLTRLHDAGSISPGPSSAPSGLAWPASNDPNRQNGDLKGPHPASDTVTPSARHLSVGEAKSRRPDTNRPRSMILANKPSFVLNDPSPSVVSPRSEEFAMAPLQPPQAVAPEDHFGLMSPSASEFSHAPLDRTALLGALGMGTTFQANGGSKVRPHDFLMPQRQPSPHQASQNRVSTITDLQWHQSSKAEEIGNGISRQIVVSSPLDDNDPIMSPRAFEFTQNPFALSQSVPSQISADTAVQEPEDPRSPAQKGASPIIRNIADAL